MLTFTKFYVYSLYLYLGCKKRGSDDLVDDVNEARGNVQKKIKTGWA
jgi:hypothetical protein